MWHEIKSVYEASRSAVLLDGKKYSVFSVEQGVAQGVAYLLYCFHVIINNLLREVEEAGLGVQLCNGKSIGGMLFVNDFVGVSDSKEKLQKLSDVVYSYCNR